MKKLLGILSMILMFSACIPDPIPITLPPYEPKIVVNSRFVPNVAMAVGLMRSFTVLSENGKDGQLDSAAFENLLLDSARVVIKYPGGIDTLFKVTDGLYASLGMPTNYGVDYSLEIFDYTTGETVTAQAPFLEPAVLDTVITQIEETEHDTIGHFKVKFQDPSQENYYMLNLYSRDILINEWNYDALFTQQEGALQTTYIYKDSEFSGSSVELDLTINGLQPTDTIAVSLSNISREYYEYVEKRMRSGNIFTEISGEPINYPSNIKGGLGFFTTHFPDVITIDLNDF